MVHKIRWSNLVVFKIQETPPLKETKGNDADLSNTGN